MKWGIPYSKQYLIPKANDNEQMMKRYPYSYEFVASQLFDSAYHPDGTNVDISR